MFRLSRDERKLRDRELALRKQARAAMVRADEPWPDLWRDSDEAKAYRQLLREAWAPKTTRRRDVTPKFVEIRDRGTSIPALAMDISERDGWLARRAGFGAQGCILLVHLTNQECRWDPYEWNQQHGRTMHVAHLWLAAHWAEHIDGGVVDVKFILSETAAPKVSERETTSA